METPDAEAERALVLKLCDGPFEQPLWSGFLAALRVAADADYAGISFRPTHQPLSMPVELYSGRAPPAGLVEFYRGDGYKRDPLVNLTLQPGVVYRAEDLLDPDNAEHRQFFDSVLAPRGMRHLLITQVREPSGVKGTLCITRDARPFTAEDAALLARLSPCFERALRTHLAIDQARFNVAVSSNALGRLNFGWIGLSESGRILEASAHAESLLGESQVVSRGMDGAIRTSSTATNRELAAILRLFAGNRQAPPRALNVSREPWFELLLVPVNDRADTAASRPICIAYLHADRRASTDRHRQLAELFGLTNSEARLALSLSRGRSIADSAADLGLTIETARNYSKKIYAKTGARGQGDLIRFVLSSVLALA